MAAVVDEAGGGGGGEQCRHRGRRRYNSIVMPLRISQNRPLHVVTNLKMKTVELKRKTENQEIKS